MEAKSSKEEEKPLCAPKQSKSISERELRKRARKLDLAPILGKAFRYVTVNKNGECEEIDEQTVHERRESFVRGMCAEITLKKTPIKKLRKARQASLCRSGHTDIDIREGFNKADWLPDSFTITRTTQTHISGWVNSEDDLTRVLTSHSDAFSCRFVSWYRGRGLGNSFDSKRIAWKREDIEPDCPFTIDSYQVRHCPHGMKLKRLTEVRESFRESEELEKGLSRSVTCHARLKIRRVTLYEDFRLNPEDKTKKIMFEKMGCAKQMINQGQEIITSNRIYLQLPLPAAHRNHTVPHIEENNETKMSCEEGIQEAEPIKSMLSKEQKEISYCEPKLGLKEIDDTTSSVGDAFQMVTLPVNEAETNVNQWKVEQSFIVDTVNKALRSDIQPINRRECNQVKKNEEFQFEIRPPQKRTHILASCKVDCPARIKVKRVSLYESFRLEEGDSRRKKDDKMLMVKDMINNRADGLQATAAIFMQLPLAAAHRNHHVSVPVEDSQQEISSHLLANHQYDVDNQQQYQHMSWLPPCFIVTTCEAAYVTGWVHSEEEYLQVLERHRLAFGCAFLAWSNDKERTFKAEADRRVMWKKDFIDPGCPLTVHHSLILACAYSDQGKGKSQVSSIQNLQAHDLPCLAPGIGEGIIQVPPELVPDGTSLEIQYCDTAHQYSELQSLIKQDETFIILVENS